MVQHLALYQLDPHLSEDQVDDLLRISRSHLLRLPGVLCVKSGRSLEASDWTFFISMEFGSRDKMSSFLAGNEYRSFLEKHVSPVAVACMEVRFELEPGKPPKYS